MKLRDLDAELIGNHQLDPKAAGFSYSVLDSIEGAQGLSFQCPKCAEGKPVEEEDGKRFVRGAHRIICWFRNPRNAQPVPDDETPGPGRWWIEGSSIDDLTFTHGNPSKPRSIALKGGCNWHGFIDNGDAHE